MRNGSPVRFLNEFGTKFATLIKKDRGIGPADVLATCSDSSLGFRCYFPPDELISLSLVSN